MLYTEKDHLSNIINITNSILSYVSVNSIFFNSTSNIYTRIDACNLYNKIFKTIEVKPIYTKLTEILKSSLDNTLKCNYLNNRIKQYNINIIFNIVWLFLFLLLIIFCKKRFNKLK